MTTGCMAKVFDSKHAWQQSALATVVAGEPCALIDPPASCYTILPPEPHSCGGRIISSPPMNGRSVSGTSTLPSACWYVSRMAISSRGTAHAVAFSVWQNSVAPLRAGGFPAPSAARGLGLAQ